MMEMNKAILKNGMHVITRNGNEYVIMSDVKANKQKHITNEMIGLNVKMEGYINIDTYNDDLTKDSNHDYDIQIIFTPHYYRDVLSSVRAGRNNFDLVAVRWFY